MPEEKKKKHRTEMFCFFIEFINLFVYLQLLVRYYVECEKIDFTILHTKYI